MQSIRVLSLRAEELAETTLREQADLLNLTYDAIFVRYMNGTVKYWNWSAEGIAGMDRGARGWQRGISLVILPQQADAR